MDLTIKFNVDAIFLHFFTRNSAAALLHFVPKLGFGNGAIVA
jgi:hypothetical protein